MHKFAAGHRYLSYLRPNAEEQWAALHDTRIEHDDRLSATIENCKQQGRFMIMRYPDFSEYENGQLFDYNRSNKGILRPDLRALSGRVVLEQTGEPRALDWYGLESGYRPFRWSGPNPKPKILIPYTYRSKVRITLCVPAIAGPPLKVRIEIDGRPVNYEIQETRGGNQTVMLRTQLKPRIIRY